MANKVIPAYLVKYQFKRNDFVYDPKAYTIGRRTDREKLLSDARKVAKATNQRLLRLEKAGMTSSPAYQGAKKSLSGLWDKGGKYNSLRVGHIDKNGRPRYKENVNSLTNDELRDLLYRASGTQTARTSTIAGTKEVYQESRDRLQKYIDDAGVGRNISINDVIKVVNNKALVMASNRYGYNMVLQAISDGKDKDKDFGKLMADAVMKGMTIKQVKTALGWDVTPESLGIDPTKWKHSH